MKRTTIPLLAVALAAIALPPTLLAVEGDDPDVEVAAVTAREAATSLGQVVPEAVAPSEAETIAGVRSDPTLRAGADQFTVAGTVGRAVIARDPSEGFSLATTVGRLEVVPRDVDFDASAPLLVAGGDAVISANTGEQSDTLVRPDSGGIETFTQIRGPEAPEEYSWTVELPGQEALRLTAAGGAEVIAAGGRVVASVDAPWARDAAGVAVTTWLTVSDDTLTLHVTHLVEGVSYPVVADPHWFPGWLKRAGSKAGSGLRWFGGAAKAATSAMGDRIVACATGAWASARGVRFKNPWLIAVDAGVGCATGVGVLGVLGG
jgi:hypothetical protein